MRKLIDEKGRLGGKLSVIDLAIILLVILVAIGAYLNFFVLRQTAVTVEAQSVRYTIEVGGVRHWGIRNIRVGDTLFSAGTEVGTIQSIEVQPHMTLVFGADGPWWGEVPERYTLLIEVSATATITDGRFLVPRTVPMNAGNSGVGFSTRYASFHGTLTEIVLYD